MTEHKIEIEICMGSSCFARGNSTAVSLLKDFIQDHGLTQTVLLKGALCQGRCKEGPNTRVNGKDYPGIDGAALLDVVRAELGGRI